MKDIMGHWAIRPQLLQTLQAGDLNSPLAVRQALSTSNGAPPAQYTTSAGTAIIHITGIITKYAESPPIGTDIQKLTRQLRNALKDDSVKKIFLRIESPGGTLAGLPDFAEEVYRASQQKEIIAFADDLAASAAYWIGSQANAFYANKSAVVGSIGVYMVLPDTSAAAEKAGVKINLVSSGLNKGVGTPGTTITNDQLRVFQAAVDADLQSFVDDIGRARNMKLPQLREIADGREFNAKTALDLKLIDGIMTFEEALEQSIGRRPKTQRRAKTAAPQTANAGTIEPAADPYRAALARHIATGMSRADAVRKVIREQPELHRAHLGQPPQSDRARPQGNPLAFVQAVNNHKSSGLPRAAAVRKAIYNNPADHAAWLAAKQQHKAPALPA